MLRVLRNEKVKAISTLVIRTRLTVLKPTPLLPHAKMLLVPIFFFWQVDSALEGSMF